MENMTNELSKRINDLLGIKGTTLDTEHSECDFELISYFSTKFINTNYTFCSHSYLITALSEKLSKIERLISRFISENPKYINSGDELLKIVIYNGYFNGNETFYSINHVPSNFIHIKEDEEYDSEKIIQLVVFYCIDDFTPYLLKQINVDKNEFDELVQLILFNYMFNMFLYHETEKMSVDEVFKIMTYEKIFPLSQEDIKEFKELYSNE